MKKLKKKMVKRFPKCIYLSLTDEVVSKGCRCFPVSNKIKGVIDPDKSTRVGKYVLEKIVQKKED